MLKEIRCEHFKQKAIVFHPGLNVILGDEKAANSIGKSSLLMVIDFVFGGSSLTEIRTDIIKHLGHHSYDFSFSFEGEMNYFRRETCAPKVVYMCDKNFETQRPLSLIEYKEFLAQKYKLSHLLLGFRDIVSLYSRIWLKGNDDVRKPLNVSKKQKEADAIRSLLALFDKYKEIQELELEWKRTNDSRKSLADAIKSEHIPKITKLHYKANSARVASIKKEIIEIKQNLAAYACSLHELINKEILELNTEKDTFLEYKLKIESKLQRVRKNLEGRDFIKSKNIQKLQEFFPGVNINKIMEIEQFHAGLRTILKTELKASSDALETQLANVELEIMRINRNITNSLNTRIDNPSLIVDRVVKLNSELHKLEEENFFYDKKNQLTLTTKDIKETLFIQKQKVNDIVSGVLNNKLRQITTTIYSANRHSPQLVIHNNQYAYETHEDTGTGKAYTDLILFDLAVFDLTNLPFIIHDSILFKNIENDAVSKLITFYNRRRQVFIALDEIEKYGPTTEKVLQDNKVIKLDNNNLLYTADWRKLS